jgi:Flp pilus assembly protein TadG
MRVRAFNKMSPLRGCEAGQSLMEFALVLPLLLLLLLGIIQFGAAFNALIVLNAAAQEGARVMAIEGAGAEAEAEAKAVVLDRCTAAPFLSCNETDIVVAIELKENLFKEVTVTVPGTVPLFLFIFSESELSLAGKAIMRLEPVIQEAP